jgi:hypothetical protein
MSIRPGTSMAEVRQRFGTPWKVERYYFSGLTAWLYPHSEGGFFNSVAAVHFDAQGRTQRVENGPDPRFIGGSERD